MSDTEAIPIDDLRDLVEQWRDEADVKAEITGQYDVDLWGEVGVLEIKADQLERVIQDAE